MLLTGEVLKVIFRNAENGYTVLEIFSSGDHITAVGVFPDIYDGARVELSGDYKYHTRHGLQFLVEDVKVLAPDNAKEIEKFLKSGLFKGIGEVTAGKIVDALGDKTLEIIRTNPAQLARINGIGERKALALSKTLIEHGDMQEALVFLQKFDISLNLALKIYRVYGARTEEIIRTNPYQLISDIERVGFATADKIAETVGIERDSDFRICAGIIYVLKETAAKNGHTTLPEVVLIKELFILLGFDKNMLEKINNNIEDLIFLSELKDYYFDNIRYLMLYRNFITERTIAKRLIRLKISHNVPTVNFDAQISCFETTYNIKLHDMQKEAVNKSLNSGVHIITGGPGTGKTTIIKCILHILKSLKLSYQLCAPTGRAAKRMSEATGENAMTIHRLLDLDFKDGKGYFTYNENTRIPADVIIVDEVSMVDEYVFSSLIKAINDGCGLILVGDKDQLASVGAGNVLADIMSSGIFGVTHLDKIYRQCDGSMIIENAHAINQGRMPVLDNRAKDFFYVSKQEPTDIAEEVTALVTTRLPSFLNCKSKDIQVLCPMKKGYAGVINLNKILRDEINPKISDKQEEISCGEYTFRIGDKIMQTVNSYEQEWCDNTDGHTLYGRGVYNGDMGYVIDINRAKMNFTIEFDDGKVAIYSFGDIDQIIPAYAVSVHKSQGSEFRAVVIALSQGNYYILTRNLLYTAVTRAKEMVVLVGDEDVIRRMVRNNYTAKRYTLLTRFILVENEENSEGQIN